MGRTTPDRKRWAPWRVYAWTLQMHLAAGNHVEAEVALSHLMTVLQFGDEASRSVSSA